jgi:cell division transport system permease protein
MTLRYVVSETGTGLRRNVSMSIALIVTIFVSLTLVGMGLLLNAQAHKAETSWGNKLQITVFLCNQNSQSPNCSKSDATEEQKDAVRQVLDTNPEVSSYYGQSKQQAYDIWKRVYISKDRSEQRIYSTVTPQDMQESFWVKLKDPKKYAGVESQLRGMPGVDNVRDLRQVLKPIYFWMTWFKVGALIIAGILLLAAILQVTNTIRLTAFARRKEIGIMRLVGASNLYISLPFLLETLIATLIGIALAGGALAFCTWVFIYRGLRGSSRIAEWISWRDTLAAFGWIALIGVVLTMFTTLVMTRKYLKV